MNFNYVLLIMWTISGILTIIQGLTTEDKEVPLLSYILIWICLMCTLIIDTIK